MEIAKRLGFTYYDQELIDRIAKSAKLRKETVAEVDEKGRTAIQDFIHGLLNPDYVSDVTFVKHLTNVIVSLAYRGRAVILGRGACYVTPKDKGLHVRITAPLPVRIDRAIHYEGHSLSEAKKVIKSVGKDRREFIKQYFGRDISNTNDYDLTINTEHFTVQDCVEVITKAFDRKFPKKIF
jgi:cytidylate kinase